MPADRRKTITVYLTDGEYAALDQLRGNIGIKVSKSALAEFGLKQFLRNYADNPAQLLLDLNLPPKERALSVSDKNNFKGRG